MTFKHITLALLLASFAWTGCKKDEEPDPTPTLTIVPGIGITEVKIGDAAQVAIDLFGSATPASTTTGGLYYHYLVFTSKGVTIYMEPNSDATFNAQMKIISLKLSTNFTGKTDKGIGIGSTKTEVVAAYGNPESSSPTTGDVYASGITFFYGADSKVASIEVKKPSPALAALTILPGIGIKEVKIGDVAQVAIDLFGIPFPASASAGGLYYHYIVYTSKGATIYMEPTTEATFNPQMKIKSLKLTANFTGKTEKAIGIGSTKANVISAYGNPDSSSPSTGDVYAIGISFFYGADSKVSSMEVKKP